MDRHLQLQVLAVMAKNGREGMNAWCGSGQVEEALTSRSQEELLIDKDSQPRGLLTRFDELNGPQFSSHMVAKEVAGFYEQGMNAKQMADKLHQDPFGSGNSSRTTRRP
jgi:hypothetical protein